MKCLEYTTENEGDLFQSPRIGQNVHEQQVAEGPGAAPTRASQA